MGNQTKITKVVVHHSASPRDTTSRERIRGWHIDRGWNDIGYHWIIEGEGKVSKGREENKIGAHAKGHNRGTIGICVTGNFEHEHPSPIQWALLKCIVQYLLFKYKLTYNDVTWHRKVGKTACPGKNMIAKLEDWLEGVS